MSDIHPNRYERAPDERSIYEVYEELSAENRLLKEELTLACDTLRSNRKAFTEHHSKLDSIKDGITRLKSELAARDEAVVALREALDERRNAAKNLHDLNLKLSAKLSACDANTVALREALNACAYDYHLMAGGEHHPALKESTATKAAVNRVRADAVEAAMQKIIDEANAEEDMDRSAHLLNAAFTLEDYANKLLNGG